MTHDFNCPDCSRTLHVGATYCGCGWKRRKSPFADALEVTVNCAHFNCRNPAKVKIKTKTGHANLCMAHYDQHYRDEALDGLDKLGLAKLPDETTAEHVARMRAYFKKGFKAFKTNALDENMTANAALNALVEEFTTDDGMAL